MSTFRQPAGSSSGKLMTTPSPTILTSPQFLQPSLPNPSSSSLDRRTSAASSSTGRIPSPRPPIPASSRRSSFKVLSRNSSLKDKHKKAGGHIKEVSNQSELSDDGVKSPQSENGSPEVVETGAVRVQKDHESGRWMINQYRAIKIVDRNPKRKRLTGLGRKNGMKSGRDGAKMLNESEIRKEIAIFKKVNHPNVVRMREIIDDPESSKIYMIMEWCENGEINWKEAEGSPALTVGETRKIFRDTLLGLEYQALRTAAAQPGPEGDAYVDDIELAKTAGSPAFFAPEMCYSGLDTEISQRSTSSPQTTPINEVPSFTLRPPSAIETRPSQSDPSNLGSSIPLRQTISNESAFPRRPPSARSHSSSATIHRRERLPITNAIDVWALGVTLYCLFFGRTPFDAPNEYLLMQVIPVQDYVVPPFVGKDKIPTGTGGLPASEEARDCLDLLKKLLEKDPAKRITLEQAKTDPHTQTFVTVSNDEVAAVITKSTGFRDRFRKGIKSISHKLFSGSSRTRSQSFGDHDTESPGESHTSGPSHHGTPRSSKLLGIVPTSRDISPMTSPLPAPGLSRRLSLLGAKLLPGDSPPQPQGASPNISGHTSPESNGEVPDRTPSVGSAQSTSGRSFMVHRQPSTHLVPPIPSTMVPLADETPRSPRPIASSSSLDKFKTNSDLSPQNSLRRRGSGDIDVINREAGYRPRAHSNASSISSKLARLLRTGSQRSRRQPDKEILAASDVEESAMTPSAASSSPADALGRISLDEGPRRSMETFESGSYSSQPRAFAPSPERGTGQWNWDNRLRAGPLRRGSNLSEEYRPVDEEEVDWNGPISDEDEYGEEPNNDINLETTSSSRLNYSNSGNARSSALTPSAPNFPSNWRRGSRDGLGLDMQLPPPSTSSQPVPVAATPTLDPIPDGSPVPAPSSLSIPTRNSSSSNPSPISPSSPSSTSNPINISLPSSSTETIQRTPSRSSSRLSQSPFRSSHLGERARSPLGPHHHHHHHYHHAGGGPEEPNLSTSSSSPRRSNFLSRQTSAPVFDLEEQDDLNNNNGDEDEDQGLAISIGSSRRGRKGSMLSNR
ncbi:uncharacterized protein L201_004929 [Kwoniella dendrophila CBS 6074]|uniref:non-specific serine/threonine protein kinase n=1 Tax=Kwoniella dendrophila CBS 6074 TaxID=1295534 RepID=A0AAX4JXQ0_9TREE